MKDTKIDVRNIEQKTEIQREWQKARKTNAQSVTERTKDRIKLKTSKIKKKGRRGRLKDGKISRKTNRETYIEIDIQMEWKKESHIVKW